MDLYFTVQPVVLTFCLWTEYKTQLFVCLGAFRTSPITSLHMEANELPLQLRRQKLALQYVVKRENNQRNPAYASVFLPNFKPLFEARPSVIPTLGLRMHQTLSDCIIELGCIAQYSIPSSLPWLLRRPCFDYTLYSLGSKWETLPDLH
jgi:hypothetical protein